MSIENSPARDLADAGPSIVTETPAPELKVSMEDTIRNAFRAQQKTPEATPDVIEPAADEVSTEPSTELTVEPRKNAAGRLIDEQGRFIKKDGTVVETEAEADLAQEAKAPEQPSKFTEAPKSWKAEAKAGWDKIPENMREEIYRREEDVHRGIQQYKQMADVGNSLHKVIEPYGGMIVKAGMTAPALIGDLLNMQKVMTTGAPEERVSLALQILNNSGVTLDALSQAHQQHQAQPQADPNVIALIQKVQDMEKRFQGQDQQREQAELASINSEVEKFRTDGKHEHFNKIALDMSALISQGRADGLQDAYDKAVWANPETRAIELQKHEQERSRKQAEEAAAARKASGATVIKRGTPPAPVKPGTMEDTIRQTLRKLNG